MPVDWEKLFDEWDKVPEEQKKKIADLFRAKTKEKLAELFQEEPESIFVYVEAVKEIPPLPAEVGVTDEWLDAVKFVDPSVKPEVTTHPDYTYSVLLNKYVEELGDTPMGIMPLKTPPEVEEFLKRGEFDGWIWSPEDITYDPKYSEWRDIYHYTYSRDDLEAMKVDELKRISQIKGVKIGKTKEEMIANILGIPVAPPPPVAPPAAPPPKPPEKPPPKPPVAPPPGIRGLQKADEKRLKVRFEARLGENTIRIERRWTSMFEDRLYEWREAFKDLSREEAVSRAFDEVERLVESILPLAKPPRVPPVRVPVVPPEVVPEFPPIRPVVAPPPGVVRRWGMPFGVYFCPACAGEGVETPLYRSLYLERRLQQLGIPTRDSLFFALCEDHRLKYGGMYETFPRNMIEFWVGRSLAQGEWDIADLVELEITEEYCLYARRFYEENKHLFPWYDKALP